MPCTPAWYPEQHKLIEEDQCCAIDFAKQQGYQQVTLRTFFKFVNAIHFYEKMGFEKYKQDEESYFYRKQL